ncbi:MAG TPA: hypothetical protein PLP01_02330 [Phycisphaerae bacterium]|nr:hypothetical protein [Phycisphaerae bacterium]
MLKTSKLLSCREAAAHLGLNPQTLAAGAVTWRYGLPMVEVEDRSGHYIEADAEAWLEAGTVGGDTGKRVESPDNIPPAFFCAPPPAPPTWRLLAANLDTLHLNLYITWDGIWRVLSSHLDAHSRTSPYAPFPGLAPYAVDGQLHVTGEFPGFPFRLRLPTATIHLKRTAAPPASSPNAIVHIGSRALWTHNCQVCIDQVIKAVAAFGGRIDLIQPSRCDLAADFLLPGGLTDDFLKEHTVARSRKRTIYTDSTGRLESYYVGQGGDISLRIYDKERQLATRPDDRSLFLNAWGLTSPRNVWRVEYQLRRERLKGLGVETLDNLTQSLRNLWVHLTTSWASLRLPDNPNQTRRAIHPGWKAVQAAASTWGDDQTLQLRRRPPSRDISGLVNQMAGCLVGLAARTGLETLDAAYRLLGDLLTKTNVALNFPARLAAKRLDLGLLAPGAEESEARS